MAAGSHPNLQLLKCFQTIARPFRRTTTSVLPWRLWPTFSEAYKATLQSWMLHNICFSNASSQRAIISKLSPLSNLHLCCSRVVFEKDAKQTRDADYRVVYKKKKLTVPCRPDFFVDPVDVTEIGIQQRFFTAASPESLDHAEP
jgi:hypothetical protein